MRLPCPICGDRDRNDLFDQSLSVEEDTGSQLKLP